MRILSSGVAAALLFGASMAHAAGLGKLTVNSALGQILNAEIELVSLQPGELESLTARVAAPEAFREARIEYGSALRLLRFAVEKRANGQPYLKITSVAPINEPFVDALIEVTWPAGRVQREYPILLDPPGFAQGKGVAATTPAPAQNTPPASAPAVASSSPAPAAVTAGTGSPSAQAELGKPAETKAGEGKAAGDTYGPVQKGENLRKIAEEVKPSSVSLEQMLVALYRENKGAFAGNNMNRLKTGQILKVPSAEDVDKIAKKEANKEISTHVADWKSYRDSVASGVGSIPARPETSNASSGRIASAAVAPPPAPVADANKDVLKVTKSDAAGKAGAGKGGDAAKLASMQEELIAKDKALKESQSRVSDLEKQIKDMQRLLDLKGATPGKADPKVAAVPAPTPAPAKVEPAKAPEPVKAPEPPKAAEPAKPAEPAKTAEPPKPAEPPKVADAPKVEPPKAAPPKAAAPKKPPPPPKSFMDEVMEEPLYLAGGGLGIVALAGGAFAFMRRRKAKNDEGPSSAMTSAFPSDLKPDSTTGKSGGGLVDTGNSSFLTDFDKTGPGTIDTDEVDPVAEAEVYIAYGRDAQAEEILKEAMARDKSRHEISLKLLEIYHARKSATAFETVAKELRGAVGEQHPLWQKAAAMGAQIDPTNPLYVGAANGTATFTAMAPSAPAPKPELDFDVLGGGGGSAASGEGEAPAPAPSMDFDLDLGSGGDKPAEVAAPAPAAGLDFDIASSLDTQAMPASTAAAEPPKEEKPSFDFDLSGLDFPTSKSAEAAPGAAEKPALDLTDLSLEAPAAEAAGGSEAVGTKLELAKAYLEIGDKDGAREILNEVAKEGSAAQKEEAQKLIATL